MKFTLLIENHKVTFTLTDDGSFTIVAIDKNGKEVKKYEKLEVLELDMPETKDPAPTVDCTDNKKKDPKKAQKKDNSKDEEQLMERIMEAMFAGNLNEILQAVNNAEIRTNLNGLIVNNMGRVEEIMKSVDKGCTTVEYEDAREYFQDSLTDLADLADDIRRGLDDPDEEDDDDDEPVNPKQRMTFSSRTCNVTPPTWEDLEDAPNSMVMCHFNVKKRR